MRSNSWVILLGLLLLPLVAATESYMYVYYNHKKLKMKVSLANFGYFKYGHMLNGRVHVGARYVYWGDKVDKDRYTKSENGIDIIDEDPIAVNTTELNISGCESPLQQFNEDYISSYGSPIYFVEHGNCSFTQKARIAAKTGKMLIIGDNSQVEDIDDIIMGEDLSGDRVTLPVVMVSKNDALTLRSFLFEEMQSNITRNKDKQVWVSIVFNKPHEGKKARIQYWMIPSQKSTYSFFKTHTKFIESLADQQKIDFEVHFAFFHCNDNCKNLYVETGLDLESHCLFNGQYCNFDAEGKGPLTGADSVRQAVRELCVYKYYPQYFLSYFIQFYFCFVEKQLDLQLCDAAAKLYVIESNPQAIEQKFESEVKQCEEENTLLYPTLLSKEQDLYRQTGVKYLPSLFVNGEIFRGDLQLQEATEEFICSGIENNDTILECKKYAEITDDRNIDNDFTTRSSSGHGHQIAIFCVLLFIALVCLLYHHRRKTKMEISQELSSQVDSAIKQYYALNNEA